MLIVLIYVLALPLYSHTKRIQPSAAGKLADLVILDKNPLEKVINVSSVHRVVKGGVIYDPEKLLKSITQKVH